MVKVFINIQTNANVNFDAPEMELDILSICIVLFIVLNNVFYCYCGNFYYKS